MSLVSPILPRRTRLLLACLSPAVSLMVLGGPFTQIGIAQLGLPATVVAALVALHPLTAICRPWFGRLSDRFPFWGYRRSGYLRAGLFGSWAVFPLPLLGLLALGHHWPGASAEQRLLALVGEGLLVVLLGLANQLVHTMISTLLLEITPLPQRGGALVELWLVQSCGLVALAGITGLLLRQWQTWPLAHQLLGVWLCWGSLLVPLALWSVAGLESRHGSRHAGVAPLLAPPLENPPRRAAFWAPAGFVDIALFCFLLVLQSALFVQEVLLDPYATERFGWTLSRTTFLGAIWAVGSVGGLLVGERWPRLRRGGCPGTDPWVFRPCPCLCRCCCSAAVRAWCMAGSPIRSVAAAVAITWGSRPASGGPRWCSAAAWDCCLPACCLISLPGCSGLPMGLPMASPSRWRRCCP
jgi:BCD family chlorophyll transporter-like MFS transporter